VGRIREDFCKAAESRAVESSVAELEPEPEQPEPYYFDPRKTGTVSLL
jgi:hypothetical protein